VCVLILSNIKCVCFDFIEHNMCVLILSNIKYVLILSNIECVCFDFLLLILQFFDWFAAFHLDLLQAILFIAV